MDIHQKRIGSCINQLIIFLSNNQISDARKYLTSQSIKYGQIDENSFIVQVCQGLTDFVITGAGAGSAPASAPSLLSSGFKRSQLEDIEKDKILANLLATKMIWVTNMSYENYGNPNFLVRYPRASASEAYKLHLAIKNVDAKEALPLIDRYLSTISDLNLKSAAATEILMDLFDVIHANDIKPSADEEKIVEKLLTHEAKLDNRDLLDRYVNKDKLKDILDPQKSTFKYLIG